MQTPSKLSKLEREFVTQIINGDSPEISGCNLEEFLTQPMLIRIIQEAHREILFQYAKLYPEEPEAAPTEVPSQITLLSVEPQPAPPASPPIAEEMQRRVTGQAKRQYLDNGWVGRNYIYQFRDIVEGYTDFRVTEVEGLPKIGGMQFDASTQTLSGVPQFAGTHELKIHIQQSLANRPYDRPSSLVREWNFIINPDPQSLWQEKPSDRDDPYWKPDVEQKMLLGAPLFLLAASKRGRSHAHEGKFRDDDFQLCYMAETGWYILAVADGAGSARYSRRGSQLACATASQYLETAITTELGEKLTHRLKQYQREASEKNRQAVLKELYEVLGESAFAAVKQIENEAENQKTQTRDFATTLLLVIVRRFDFGYFVAAYWKGDGGVAVWDARQEKVCALGTAESGDYAGQTRFLLPTEFGSYQEVSERLHFGLFENFTAVVAMTDGVSDPKFETDNNFVDAARWRQFWQELTSAVNLKKDNAQAADELLKWLDFMSPGNHDDRTIALLMGQGNYE